MTKDGSGKTGSVRIICWLQTEGRPSLSGKQVASALVLSKEKNGKMNTSLIHTPGVTLPNRSIQVPIQNSWMAICPTFRSHSERKCQWDWVDADAG